MSCPFDPATLSFAGTPIEQSRCLLRPVQIRGELGDLLEKLPDPLAKLVGQKVSVSKAVLQHYLRAQGISEADIGGPLAASLSTISNGTAGPFFARYFIIHDVSTPNYLDKPFPANINDETWEGNDLRGKWANSKVAHVFVSRTGQSITAVDLGSALPGGHFGTKFARDKLKEAAKGLQIHIELVQPRRRDPAGSANNDALAPIPGFTEAQMDRLALIYVAASVRRGEWLIPAFHAAVDAGIPDAHDDPQQFNLDLWSRRLARLLKTLNRR